MNSSALGQARIDAHQHFWRRARGDYAWLRADDASLAPLLRDFSPADLAPLMAASGVARTVLVQAADTTAETDYLLSLAAEHDSIAGVVGWIDLSRRESIATLEAWALEPKFKSVRPMLQDLPQTDWIAHAPHPDVVRALVRLGLRFDALVKPPHLNALLRFVQAWPDLPVVIDHAAKPQLAQGWHAEWAEGWKRDMAALAAQPQVSCKFSGLLTEMQARQRVDARALLRPVWDTLLQRFGAQRVMWGSDWPVLTLAGDYAGWAALAGSFIGELSASEQAQVWHDSARRFYGLP